MSETTRASPSPPAGATPPPAPEAAHVPVRRWYRRGWMMALAVSAAVLMGIGVAGLMPDSGPRTHPVSGTVTSAITNAPLKATVHATAGGTSVTAGDNGFFTVPALLSEDVISVSMPGYRSRDYKIKDVGNILVVLAPTAATAYSQLKKWVGNHKYEQAVAWLLRPATGYRFQEMDPENAEVVGRNVARFPDFFSYGVGHVVADYRISVCIYFVKNGQGQVAQRGWMKAARSMRIAGQAVLTGEYLQDSRIQEMSWWHAPVLVLFSYDLNTVTDATNVMAGIIKAQS